MGFQKKKEEKLVRKLIKKNNRFSKPKELDIQLYEAIRSLCYLNAKDNSKTYYNENVKNQRQKRLLKEARGGIKKKKGL